MPFSRKSFYSIVETAAKWECSLRDIIDCSAGGELTIKTFLRYAETDDGPIAGSVTLSAQDLLAYFHVDGNAGRSLKVYRVGIPAEGSGDDLNWIFVRDEEGGTGVEIDINDIHITGEEFKRFQDKHEIGVVVKEVVRWRTPPAERHDWEGMYRRLCKRIFEIGLPESLNELSIEMQQGFIEASENGDAPDVSTIRKRLQPIWNDLRETA
ncbi:hypothetical protein A3734_00075 [Sulfitobacter sp. HI0054]|uniref:hypothetical protein n=1 Tax=Sulfitobacter sp. HI0054 TaxID=1822238 RepID=UPI0007C283AB|nr:hypothetical protein [Sulfitobacter sp. HI0054]KZY54268.1 hypothetical protein A3734_00075 [Sulfitobacter sp. HI0054]